MLELTVFGIVHVYVPVLAVEATTIFHVIPPSYDDSILIVFVTPTPTLVQVIGRVLHPIRSLPPFGLVKVSVGFAIVKFTLLTSLINGLLASEIRTKQSCDGVFGIGDHNCAPSFGVEAMIVVHVTPLSVEYSILTLLEG